MNILYNWIFDVTIGYNNILLPEPIIVNRGNFILLTQTTGYIALCTAGNSTYSDLAWKNTVWNPLVATSNWRFYLTPTTNFSVYQNSFNILKSYSSVYQNSFNIYHSYNWIGLYNLSITFVSSNKTFNQIVNITDCKL